MKKTVLKKIINRYYNRKIEKNKGTWKEDYYKSLRSFYVEKTSDKNFKKRIRKRINRDKRTRHYSSLRKKYMYIKFRLLFLIYGINIDAFFQKDFYKKSYFYPRGAITKFRLLWMDRRFNLRELLPLMSDKVKFAEYIGEDFGRLFLKGPCSKDKFIETFSGCPEILVKPLSNWGGKGITKYCIDNDIEEVYKQINNDFDGNIIIEEYIQQKGFMHELNHSSVNTIRIITIREPVNKNIHLVNAFARVGSPGSFVDNYCSGGAKISIDMNTGRLGKPVSIGGNKIIKILEDGNNTIPHWDEIRQYCIRMHQIMPDGIDFIGWDVCLSDDRIFLIEANNSPGFGRPYNGKHTEWNLISKIFDRNDSILIERGKINQEFMSK